jgi:hypothetical protein
MVPTEADEHVQRLKSALGLRRLASTKMPFGEDAAGAGFQIALEREGSRFVDEPHQNIDLPRSPAVRM